MRKKVQLFGCVWQREKAAASWKPAEPSRKPAGPSRVGRCEGRPPEVTGLRGRRLTAPRSVRCGETVPLRRTSDRPKAGAGCERARGWRFGFDRFRSLRWLPAGWRRWEDEAGTWGNKDERDGPTEAGLVLWGQEHGPGRPHRCRATGLPLRKWWDLPPPVLFMGRGTGEGCCWFGSFFFFFS